jgi:hypothetical protein
MKDPVLFSINTIFHLLTDSLRSLGMKLKSVCQYHTHTHTHTHTRH